MSDSAAMLNVRMSRGLKEAGDAVLAEAGVTVSELVRALWTKLAKGGAEAQEQLRVILASTDAPDSQRETERKKTAVQRIDASLRDFTRDANVAIDNAAWRPLTDDKDEIARQRQTYMREKWGEL